MSCAAHRHQLCSRKDGTGKSPLQGLVPAGMQNPLHCGPGVVAIRILHRVKVLEINHREGETGANIAGSLKIRAGGS